MGGRMGQAEQDRQNRTVRTGQAEQNSQNRTGRTGPPKQDRQNRTGIAPRRLNTRLLPGLAGTDLIFQWIGMVEYILCDCTMHQRYTGCYTVPATRLVSRKILIEKNIKNRTGPALCVLCAYHDSMFRMNSMYRMSSMYSMYRIYILYSLYRMHSIIVFAEHFLSIFSTESTE
jgi:hypothetical protein